MRRNYPPRPNRLVQRNVRALLFPVGLLLELSLGSGCAKVCDDDGFAWQQDPSCLNNGSQTDSDTNEEDSDSESASEPTETASEPTDTNGGEVYCVDGDGDGFGDPTMCTPVPPGEDPPPGTVPSDNGEDCDDMDMFTFPGAAPNDSETLCMTDVDGDDYGDMDPPGDGGPNEPQPGTDCDDSNPNTFPGSSPLDSLDECMQDNDGDDHGDDDPPPGPDGPIKPGTDCDDDDPNMNEMCPVECEEDMDMDGWCGKCEDDICPPGFPTLDCDDGDDHTFPGSAPKDDPEACMTDADDDDYGDDTPSDPDAIPGTDCDDDSASTFPGSAPLDSDTACMKDEDGDDHGEADPDNENVTPGNDCNDHNDSINPTDSVLVTAETDTGAILAVDIGTGVLTGVSTIDTTGFTPWIPTSLAIKPSDRSVYASLGFKSRLVTMNYCGGGTPTALPAAHGRTGLCALGFDKDDNLYGVDNVFDELIMFNADGSIASNTKLSADDALLNVGDCGMTWDCHQGRMLLSDSGTDAIYTVDTATAIATKVADVPGESIGSGLAYEPVSKQALTCDINAFYSVAIDGSNQFTKLADLVSIDPVDDLEFAPGCD